MRKKRILLALIVPPVVLLLISTMAHAKLTYQSDLDEPTPTPLYTPKFISRRAVEDRNSLPLVYYQASNPTPEPEPEATPTPDPSKWMWLLRSVNVGDENYTYAQVAGVQWELEGVKIGKTIYISQYCPTVGGVPLVCNVWGLPPSFPAECNWETGEWCEVEKLVFPQNAARACSLHYPYNCVDVK